MMGAAGQGGGYEIDQSALFAGSTSDFLSEAFGTPTDNNVWTLSMWVKRSAIKGVVQGLFGAVTASSFVGGIYFLTDETLKAYVDNSSVGNHLETTQVFRDPSAWYHIMWTADTDNATATNRSRLYLNGVEITAFDVDTQNSLTGGAINKSGSTFNIGKAPGWTAPFDGYLAEVQFIDGQQLTPASFGEYNDDGVWVPKAYTGTYGNNGAYLDFADSGALGTDVSGNGNDWTVNGTITQVTDSPTENYATYLPLYGAVSYPATFSNGNLTAAGAGSTGKAALASIGPTTGKFYSEFTLDVVGTTVLCRVGVSAVASLTDPLMFSSGEFAPQINSVHYFANGTRRLNNSDTSSWGSTFTNADVIGVAYDADTGKIWFAKNNTWQASGDPAAGSDPAATLTTGVPFYFNNQIFDNTWTADFGQSGFEYTPPTGFNALNTANLPTPTIADGSANFQTTLYTGNGTAIGSGGLAVSQSENSTFQPDFVWIKRRNSTVQHALTDAVRGVTKELNSDAFTAESTVAEGLTTFGSAGFTVGSDASYNTNAAPYVAWQWKANGSGSSNEDGSINTTATSVNTAAGISIMTYVGNATAGATIGHGLGKKPGLVIAKTRNSGQRWWVYHEDQGATKYGILELSNAFVTSSLYWNDTEPTDTLISLGSGLTNMSGINMLAYAFTEIPGFSRIGAYTGNGNANGAFIHTGFQPAWLMIKRTNSTSSWGISDTKRLGYNVDNDFIMADTVAAEVTYDYVDLLSNGFKIRNSGTAVGVSGSNYVYMAFAENPFGGDGVAPATAR